MVVFPIRDRLPAKYNAAIGRVVARFAVLEATLRNVIYIVMDVNPKFGRVAVRSPRVGDSFIMIQDLMLIRQFKTSIDLKLLARECKKFEQFRDKIAHGIWVKHGKSKLPILQVTAGSYARTQGGESVKARIEPMAVNVTIEDFRECVKGIDNALKAIRHLGLELHAQHRAWHEKQLQQLMQGQSPQNPPNPQNPAKQKRPRRSSPGPMVSG